MMIYFILNIYFVLDNKVYDTAVLFTNFIIIMLTIFGMYCAESYNYSLNKIFSLFSFFFFGISPSIEFLLDVRYWKGEKIFINEYLKMNIIIIIILLLYYFFYFLFKRMKKMKMENIIVRFFSKNIKKEKKIKKIFLIISVISLIILLYLNNFNVKGLLFRGGVGVERREINKAYGLIILQFIRPIPVVCLIFSKILKLKGKIFKLILILIFLLTNFPTSSARFYTATVYIPILLLYIPKYKEKLVLNQSLILGILFIFPLFNKMRNYSGLDTLNLKFNFNMFLEGHFDSYQNFTRVVTNDIITNGTQLLTTLLFFIPRTFWPDKSIGSGAYLQKKIGLSFSNIAMNYFGEGYINFGYIGIILFTIVISYLNARFDKTYWNTLQENNILRVIYLLFLGLEFFILRGDLLSSYAYTVGMISSVIFIYILIKR